MTKKFISQNDDVAPELTSDPIFVAVVDTPKKPNQAMQIHRDKNLKHLSRLFPRANAEKIEAYYNKKYEEWHEIDPRAEDEGSNYHAYTETIVAIDNALWKREEEGMV